MESPDDALREWLKTHFYAFGCEEDVARDADNLMKWMNTNGWYFERVPLEQRSPQ